MTKWLVQQTDAYQNIKKAMAVVDNLLKYMSATPGKPSKREQALYAAAVVFSYGVWENYIEDLAIELVTKMSTAISPPKVPESVRKNIEKSTAWELAIHPGWKTIWINKVTEEAKGTGDSYGLNTAGARQVARILGMVGIDDVMSKIPTVIIPPSLQNGHNMEVSDVVDRLVKLRGLIVHSGTVPTDLKKNEAIEWRNFVDDLARSIDEVCRAECGELLR